MLANPSSRSAKKVATELQLIALNSSFSLGSSASSELEELCKAAITALPSEVEAFRAGNRNVLNKIVGYVMKKSRGRADAAAARSLTEKLVLGDDKSG